MTIRAGTWDAASRAIMANAGLMQLAQVSSQDAQLDWITSNAAKEVAAIASSAQEPTHIRFDIYVHTVTPAGAEIDNLTVCRAEAGIVRELARGRFQAGQGEPVRPNCRPLGGLTSPASERNVRHGLYAVWARDNTGRVSCITEMEVGYRKPATYPTRQDGMTMRTTQTPDELRLCDDPG